MKVFICILLMVTAACGQNLFVAGQMLTAGELTSVVPSSSGPAPLQMVQWSCVTNDIDYMTFPIGISNVTAGNTLLLVRYVTGGSDFNYSSTNGNMFVKVGKAGGDYGWPSFYVATNCVGGGDLISPTSPNYGEILFIAEFTPCYVEATNGASGYPVDCNYSIATTNESILFCARGGPIAPTVNGTNGLIHYATGPYGGKVSFCEWGPVAAGTNNIVDAVTAGGSFTVALSTFPTVTNSPSAIDK